MTIQGKTYTSNTCKLLKHIDYLEGLRCGFVAPITLHLAVTNKCDLNCSFCCFKNRDRKEELSLEVVKKCASDFYEIGVKSFELTGGGEPLLHPNINEIANHLFSLWGTKVGICTNGKHLRNIENWSGFEWVRLGLYFGKQDYEIDIDYLKTFKTDISGAYVYDKLSTMDDLKRVVDFAENNKVPTRIAVDAIVSDREAIDKMAFVKSYLPQSEYCFLSDFNFKRGRKNNNCYMHMVKPFVFPDGYVYACPSSELAQENDHMASKAARLCKIENAINYYDLVCVEPIEMPCSYCKYQQQNELIEDILTETNHDDFV